ncbi:MAG: hypothetical protein ACLQT6_00105, partial [Desulfomonilaceae bacterium]
MKVLALVVRFTDIVSLLPILDRARNPDIDTLFSWIIYQSYLVGQRCLDVRATYLTAFVQLKFRLPRVFCGLSRGLLGTCTL